ncbi:MAG: hypothetical protein Q8O83_05185 [bacterium]|nr:hypothetical protein [bacterium]
MDKIIRTLAEEKYKIIFSWINKRDWGIMLFDTDIIQINLELILATLYIHEWYHAEDGSLPPGHEAEELAVLKKEAAYIAKQKDIVLQNMGQYIEQYHLLPHLLKKYAPSLLADYKKILKQRDKKDRQKKKKAQKR